MQLHIHGLYPKIVNILYPAENQLASALVNVANRFDTLSSSHHPIHFGTSR